MPTLRRPAAAEDRHQGGHWEGDLIIGEANRSAAATTAERRALSPQRLCCPQPQRPVELPSIRSPPRRYLHGEQPEWL